MKPITLMRNAIRSLLLTLLASTCLAHELPDNRLTLVLRDDNHLALSFYVQYADALHRALSPQTSFQEFTLVYSSMAAPAFEKEMQRAQTKFRSGTRVTLASGTVLTIANWQWPDTAKVRRSLQEQAMASVVAPNAHSHEVSTEIRAEVVSAVAISAVSVQVPEEFQKVLVVSYRPAQVWVEPKMGSPVIKF